MTSIELTVKNLDDAKTEAAEKLGVSPEEVTITVLSEEKKLFGKVAYKVKAEAQVKAEPVAAATAVTPAEKKESSGKKLGKKKANDEAEVSAPEVTATAESAPAAKATGKKLGKKKAEEAPISVAAPETGAPTEVTPAEEEGSNEPDVMATEEDAKKLAEILDTLAQKSGLAAEIKVGELQGKYINLSIDGKEAGFLVGKNGEVLNSLQYLINLVVKQQMSNGVRVTLDGNDYRKRRAEALTNLAVKIAEKVIERGEEAVLEALPAFERRVIHKVVQDLEGVTTYSEGEEPDRRVVIAPLD
jgi:spoIIIJ-associated protein